MLKPAAPPTTVEAIPLLMSREYPEDAPIEGMEQGNNPVGCPLNTAPERIRLLTSS